MTSDATALSDDSATLESEIIANQEDTHAKIAGATGILALGNIASRILGLAREMVLTYLFGASRMVDAFQVATVVIRAIYDLLIGGHVNGAIIPVLADTLTIDGRDALWRVVSILMSLVMTLLTGLVIAVFLFAPQIVTLTASGAKPETLRLATDLLRFTSPALIFMGLFAIFSATLYALKRFLLPGFAGVVFNGSIVAITIVLAPMLVIRPIPFSLNAVPQNIFMPIFLERPEYGIHIVAVGWLVGAILQMLMQVIGLREARLRFTFDWRHPALRRIVLLYTPVMVSLLIDTLIARPYSYNLASQTGEGSIGYMNWATTLIQFPQGLVATAISVAILPTLAGQAAQVMESSAKAYKDILGLGLRLTTTLIIPAAIGLFVLAVPIIKLLFEHGAFDANATEITAHALRLYLIGLPFAAIDLLIVYAFYARKDTLTPTLVGIVSLIVYMITAATLLPRFGLYSLMIADSVKHITHSTISAIILRRRLNGFGDQHLLITGVKTLIAATGMAVVARIILVVLLPILNRDSFIYEAIFVTIAGGASFITYAWLSWVLHIEEFRWLLGLVRKRVFRS